jgi:type IV pilus assembly protein PilA
MTSAENAGPVVAYGDYTLRAQVTQGLNLASDLKAEVADRLAGTKGPIAVTLASMNIDRVSDIYVASLALESGAIVILYGNQAQGRLTGEMLALVPARDGAGRIAWICGHHRPEAGLDLGNPEPAAFTTLPARYLPSACRP